MKRLVFIFFVAYIMGCSLLSSKAHTNGLTLVNRTKIFFRVDDSFTTTERTLILEAFKKIKCVSGCMMFFPSNYGH